MSKIIEALQEKARTLKTKPADKTDPASLPESTRTASPQKLTQEDLAEIYFSGSQGSKKLPSPTVIRVIEKRRSFLVPWILSSLALVASIFALVSSKKIFVDIHIVDEAAVPTFTRPYAPAYSKPAAAPSVASSTLNYHEALRLNPLQFRFSGGAVLNSTRDQDGISLANSSLSG